MKKNTRVPKEFLDSMFKFSGVSKQDLYFSLRKMGKEHLKTKSMRDIWTPENPTQNYCYVVAEFVYWFVAPYDSTPFALRVPSYDTWHRFVKWPDGTIVDLSCEQFYDWSEIDYTKAKVMFFLQTGCRGPSRRARILAELMKYDEIVDKNPPNLEKYYVI